MTLEEIQESKAKEYGFKSFKDLEKSEHGSDPHWNVREDIAYTYVEYLESQTQELQEQNAELIEMLQRFIDNNMMSVTADDEAKDRLTKYNHLKSNTNE